MCTQSTRLGGPARFTVDLPLPPSVNHRYVRTRWGGVALTARARAYQEEVEAECLRQLSRIPALPPAARLGMRLEFHYPDRRRRDLDNGLKAVLDALCAALGVDDCRVETLMVTRVYSPGWAIVRATVWWR